MTTLDKIVVVKKKTALEELLKRHATVSQVKFYLQSRGESFEFYKEADEDYRRGLEETLAAISQIPRKQVIEREYLSTFHFGGKDLVVVVGDPGLVVNAAKYIGEQPLISVNPDTKRFDSVLASCTPKTLPVILDKTLDGKAKVEYLTLAQATLEDGQQLYALNDLFIGRRTHISARYQIEYDGQQERQSSSGIIVSTGTGSTGWLTSVMTGAHGLIKTEDINQEDSKEEKRNYTFARDSDYLVFAVREPFPSKITGTNIITGRITNDNPLKVISQMPEEGVIFSDGIEADYINFTAGKAVTIIPAERKVHLVRELGYQR